MTSRSRSWVIPAVAAKLIAVAGFGADSACAQELKYSLRAGATHSDNVSRTAENERSDTTADIGLNFGFERDGGGSRPTSPATWCTDGTSRIRTTRTSPGD